MSRWVKTRPARMFDQCPMLPLQHSEFEFVTCANVRFGSLADMSGCGKRVRFTPESRHSDALQPPNGGINRRWGAAGETGTQTAVEQNQTLSQFFQMPEEDPTANVPKFFAEGSNQYGWC